MKPGEWKTLQAAALVLFIVALAASGAVYYTDGLLARARQQLAARRPRLRLGVP